MVTPHLDVERGYSERAGRLKVVLCVMDLYAAMLLVFFYLLDMAIQLLS